MSSLDTYHVVPETEKVLYELAAPVNDPAKRRELKIKQYKQEKELKTRIEVSIWFSKSICQSLMSFKTVRKRRNGSVSSSPEPSSDFDHFASLLPSATTISKDDEDEDIDSDTDDLLREATLLLLRLLYAQGRAQVDSLVQELQLLQNAPSPPPQQQTDDPRQARARDTENMWRLDAPIQRGGPDGKGPLLDPEGKVSTSCHCVMCIW